jgi:hypothetical protein
MSGQDLLNSVNHLNLVSVSAWPICPLESLHTIVPKGLDSLELSLLNQHYNTVSGCLV